MAGDGVAEAGPLLRGVNPSLLSSLASCLEELAMLPMLLLISGWYWSWAECIWPEAEAAAPAESIVLARVSIRDSIRGSWGYSPESSLPADDGVAASDSGGVCGSGFSRLCLRLGFLAGCGGLDVGEDDLRPSGKECWFIEDTLEVIRLVKLSRERLRVSLLAGEFC